jgi:hypothetical protein
MFWLTWRQHRLQLLAMAAVLATSAAYLVHLALPYVEVMRLLHACYRGAAAESQCTTLGDYAGQDSGLTIAFASVNLIPALFGAFVGASLLAREYERGTHRLVWGQSVTRRRWLGTKLAILATVAVLGGTTQAILLTWTTGQFLVKPNWNRFKDPFLFDLVGVVPPALWLFALVLGVAVGRLTRRTVPAMAITLALFAVVMVGLSMLRPHYAAPQVRKPVHFVSGRDAYAVHEDWVLGGVYRGADGRDIPVSTAIRLCPPQTVAPPDNQYPTDDNGVNEGCLARHGIAVLWEYHPQRQFWRFQWTEASILLAAAALIGGLTLTRVSRRAD